MVMRRIHETRMHVTREQNEGTRLSCHFCLEARMTLIKSKHKSQHGLQGFTKSGGGDLQWLWEYGLETAAVGRAVGSSCAGTYEILQRHPETCACLCSLLSVRMSAPIQQTATGSSAVLWESVHFQGHWLEVTSLNYHTKEVVSLECSTVNNPQKGLLLVSWAKIL